jgi:hypothetical protein
MRARGPAAAVVGRYGAYIIYIHTVRNFVRFARTARCSANRPTSLRAATSRVFSKWQVCYQGVETRGCVSFRTRSCSAMTPTSAQPPACPTSVRLTPLPRLLQAKESEKDTGAVARHTAATRRKMTALNTKIDKLEATVGLEEGLCAARRGNVHTGAQPALAFTHPSLQLRKRGRPAP